MDGLRDWLVVDLIIEIREAQELDNLLRALGHNRLPHVWRVPALTSYNRL